MSKEEIINLRDEILRIAEVECDDFDQVQRKEKI